MSALLLAALALAEVPETQELRVEVVTDRADPEVRVEVHTTWLGEPRVLLLADDGVAPGDIPADGHYVGQWTGGPVRMLPVRILVSGAGLERAEVYAGVEPVHQPSDRLSYALELGDSPRAQRVVSARTSGELASRDGAWVAASMGWIGLAFLYVAWLVNRASPRGGVLRDPDGMEQ